MFCRTLAGLLFVVAAVVSTAANAVPITGVITFGGDFNPTGGTDLSDATGIDVVGDVALVTNNPTGDLAVIARRTDAAYNDFDFNPFSPLALWSVGIFTFHLENLTVDTQDSNGIILVGSGILSAAGFDDTPYAWSFSGDDTFGVFAFSSTNAPDQVAVSEPTTLGMLGLAVLALLQYRRRRR